MATTDQYFTRIPDAVGPDHCLQWNGNDEIHGGRWESRIRLPESPLDLRLTWRSHDRAPEHLVGCFRLNLQALLRDGYIRHDTVPGTVRLRFVHEGGYIYIRLRRSSPALLIGTIPPVSSAAPA